MLRDDVVTPTPRRVPEPYLRAEIAAFPLTSEVAFRCSVLELDPLLSENTCGTHKLWRACESQLTPHTGWSLDRLVAARDRGWFGARTSASEQPKPISLHVYLRKLACDYLMRRAGVTEIEQNTELSALDTAAHYRWLTISLPEDLLLAALGVEPPPSAVDIDPPLLVRRLLDVGVAEIHQHIGGSMNFPLLWVSALAALASPDVKENALESPGAPFFDGKFLVRWLLAAAIARCALAEHLIRGGNNFEDFLKQSFLLNSPDKRPSHTAWTPRRREILVAVLKALAWGDERCFPEIEPLRDLYADIHPGALTLNDNPVTGVIDAYKRCDPVAVRLHLHGENVGERWLLRKALAYLNAGNDGNREQYDHYFARIFWQTVRVRCQYYRDVVQRPLTGGLQWFIRFYNRIGKLRAPLEPILPQISFHVAGDKRPIRALELRTTAENTSVETGEKVLAYLKSWQRVLKDSIGSASETEMGIIFHFVKFRDDNNSSWSSGAPAAFWAETQAEPYKQSGKDVEHGRYVSYFADQCRKARAMAKLIRDVPSSLWVIRGLDVANDELSVPTWVLAPLFRHVIDEAAKVSILEHAGPPLRITAHVGEDFRHLMEGLRRIYEQIHYILGNTPGRLGHAVALGVDPQSWAESVGSILMPAEERLWDLVWEWRLYTKYRIRSEFAATAPVGRVDVLLNQIRNLSELVFGTRRYCVEELAEVHHVLHRFLVPPYVKESAVDGAFDTFLNAARDIKWQGWSHRHVHSPYRVGKILEVYLDSEFCFRRGQQLIDVPIHGDEVASLTAVQYALRRGIAHNGIVVEVNPSSNLLIGDLLDLRNHPILRLFPPEPEADGPPPVAIALGSDDPLTFSTQLLREYALLHQAARSAGYAERTVQDWLESIRRTGMDARFTWAWRPNAEKKAEDLIRDLSGYLHLPDSLA